MTILLFIYFLIRNISNTFLVVFMILLIPLSTASLISLVEESRVSPILLSYLKKVVIITMVLGVFNSVPNIKQMSMIFGIPAAIEIMKNPEVAKIPSNVLQIINQELEEKITKKEKSQ